MRDDEAAVAGGHQGQEPHQHRGQAGQGRRADRFERRPLLQAVLALPAAFGLTQLVRVLPAAAASPPGASPAATAQTAVFRSELTCPATASAPACTSTFFAYFGYDYKKLSATQFQVTRFTMRWALDGACAPSIDRGSGALDFQCAGDAKLCKLTGGNIWQCGACDTNMQFLPLPPGSTNWEACQCPNEKNRNAFAQGVCGPPIWVEKACTDAVGAPSAFQQINFDFQHKVTSGCPDGHVARGFLTVVVTLGANGLPTFGGDFKPNLGNPFPLPA